MLFVKDGGLRSATENLLTLAGPSKATRTWSIATVTETGNYQG